MVTVAMLRLDAAWDQPLAAKQGRIVKPMVGKVILSPDDMAVRPWAKGLERVVREMQPANEQRLEHRPEQLAA
jgi:hypothetical protein